MLGGNQGGGEDHAQVGAEGMRKAAGKAFVKLGDGLNCSRPIWPALRTSQASTFGSCFAPPARPPLRASRTMASICS